MACRCGCVDESSCVICVLRECSICAPVSRTCLPLYTPNYTFLASLMQRMPLLTVCALWRSTRSHVQISDSVCSRRQSCPFLSHREDMGMDAQKHFLSAILAHSPPPHYNTHTCTGRQSIAFRLGHVIRKHLISLSQTQTRRPLLLTLLALQLTCLWTTRKTRMKPLVCAREKVEARGGVVLGAHTAAHHVAAMQMAKKIAQKAAMQMGKKIAQKENKDRVLGNCSTGTRLEHGSDDAQRRATACPRLLASSLHISLTTFVEHI